MEIGKLYKKLEVNTIIYKAQINPGFHLKIEPICRKIEEIG